MKKVTIVGAGFAGLTLAHHLHKQGFETVIFDKQETAGGMLETLRTPHGQVETAGNALMADKNVEDLFVDVGVDFAERGPAIGKRYIFWEKPTRWPLTWGTSLKGAKQLFNFMVRGDKSIWPDNGESVHHWAERTVNAELAARLLEPALQGVYAGDPLQLSANLILRSMTKNKPPRGYYKGSIAPVNGMGSLMTALVEDLTAKGALFQQKTHFRMPEFITTPTVIATSAWSAAEIFQVSHPPVNQILKQCESVPLLRVTCFFEPSKTDLEGFGCLFPMQQKFHSLGVLFDSCIFPNRSKLRAESWIMGGARYPEIGAWSDDQVIESIVADRKRMLGSDDRPLSYHVTRWSRAIPHYTTKWEAALKSLRVNPPLYLHGNYLGQLGLSRILNRSVQLALEIKENYG